MLLADACACIPYSILPRIKAVYRFLSVSLSAQNDVLDTALITLRSFLHFVISLSMCIFHLSLWSNVIPKNVASFLYSSSLPFMSFFQFRKVFIVGVKIDHL